MSRIKALVAVLLGIAAPAIQADVISPAPGSVVRVLPIHADAFAGSSVNVVAGLNYTLFTAGGNQYAAFYAADGTLMLGQRALGSDTWETKRTRFRGNVADAHNTAAIAVDGEGVLHVAWDHHGNPLNYVRGAAPGSLELGDKMAMTGTLEKRVTYPQFLPMPDGDLLFMYRDGQSGRGNLVLNRYSTRDRKWTRVHDNLIDGERQRSAYPSATIDSKGVFHLAWNWRDSPDVATNHDLCYARSDDGGRTWKSSTGDALTVPLTAANAEYALRIPKGRTLMNPPSIGTDSAGRPIIANYWMPEGSDVPQYHIVRHTGKGWKVMQVTQRTAPFTLAGTSTKRPPLSRSVVFPYRAWRKSQEVHLVYRDDDRGGRIVMASCNDIDAAKPEWRMHDLTANSVGAWEPSLDPEQARRLQQLHMLVQSVEQRDGNDSHPVAVPGRPIASLLWSPFIAAMAKDKGRPADPASVDVQAPVEPGAVLSLLHRVVDWQLAQPYPERRDERGWEIAPFYLGVLAVAEVAPDPSRYREAMLKRFDALKWEPARRIYDADDYCVTQAYLRLHRIHQDPKMLNPSRARFDAILEKPATSRMEWGVPGSRDRWTWCDALFMGPASWLMMANATGDRRYAEFAHREWAATEAALYRPEDGWFARDESFLDLREPNGRRLFWSRGNGWVVAGLVHVLEALDANDPKRSHYLALYRRMMEAALAAQQPDGLWRPGLLDPVAHPARETSGSSFMTYALAYGANRGLLDRATVEPAVRRAWNALAACVTEAGKLEHVQPIGAAPEGFDPGHNDWFGVGAFLLAGSEVHRLAAREPAAVKK